MKFVEPNFSCERCEDTGIVSILHPRTIQQIAANPDAGHVIKKCAVLCLCEATDYLATNYSDRTKARIDGERLAGKALPVFGSRDWHIAANDHDAMVQAANYQPGKAPF
jgi:hypothetical protein